MAWCWMVEIKVRDFHNTYQQREVGEGWVRGWEYIKVGVEVAAFNGE